METAALLEAIDDPGRRRTLPAAELTEALLERIERLGPPTGAYLALTPDIARADAARADAARERGHPLPLDGMPIALKDSLDLAGVPTTGASRLFEHNVASQDAVAVHRLREAGAVVLGKTNLHELTFGMTTRNPPPFGACHNPWDMDRICGGSSGGNGAALAADLCVAALGSDTGGSIRVPSALCGVSGLRPTYGAVSTRGALHISPSLDTVGPMARSVEDVARVHRCIVGFDRRDPWAIEYPPALREPEHAVSGLRIGVPLGFFFEGLDPEVETCVRDVADALTTLGASVEEIMLPADESLCHAAATIIRAEAIALYRRDIDDHPELIGEEIRRRFELGAQLSGEMLAAAHLVAHAWRCVVRETFDTVDAILTPVTAIPAPLLDEPDSIETTWRLTHLTYPWSLAGTPSLAFPCGFTSSGLPVGAHLTAAHMREDVVLELGAAYQRVTDWHTRRPRHVRD
jgi:aspartyl-tRNA(Asn)/glutamyl-tRNA(Gln) amidotransferase subunit A